jgi:hypothetical protein
MKRFQVEDLLIGMLERRIWIAAGGTEIGDPFQRIVAWQQPARNREDLGNLSKQPSDLIMRQ